MNVLRQVLLASTFVLEECGNGHRFKREIPWAGGYAMRPIAELDSHDQCAYCGTPFTQKATGRKRLYCSPACTEAMRRP